MKRVGRMLIAAVSAVSLILWILSAFLWGRSYWVRDIVGFGRAGGNCHVVQSILGRVHVLSNLDGGCGGGITYSADRLADDAVWHGGMSSYPSTIRWRLGTANEVYDGYTMGFGGSFAGFVTHHRLVVVPYAYPAVVFAMLPAWRGALWWRRRGRVKRGRCPGCGYDLRATPERCPECGRVVG